MTTLRFLLLHSSVRTATAALVALVFLAGCQTPDLKPFASASADLATSIKKGGELAITPLLAAPMKVGHDLVPPSSDQHPGKKLQEEWDKRCKTADALLAYSASLAAIADASAHRQGNAKGLVDSVNALAKTVTGATPLTDAASNLASKVLETAAEVKAFRDLSAAVKSADPAIQAVALSLQADFVEIANVLRSRLTTQRSDASSASKPVKDFLDTVRKRRDRQRVEVAKALVDPKRSAEQPALDAELAHLDALVANAEPEDNTRTAELNRLESAIAAGKAFFAAAEATTKTWADAHRDIAVALEEKRTPNFMLLVSRAQELRNLVIELKPAKPVPSK
jgi:hypothetical protein